MLNVVSTIVIPVDAFDRSEHREGTSKAGNDYVIDKLVFVTRSYDGYKSPVKMWYDPSDLNADSLERFKGKPCFVVARVSTDRYNNPVLSVIAVAATDDEARKAALEDYQKSKANK